MQSMLRTASLFFALTLFVVVHSRGGRVYRPGNPEEDKKYVTDPSAKVEGIFRKEGDMTFIMNSDPLADDFEGGAHSDGRRRRNAVLNAQYLWPNAEVPYEIASVFNARDRTVIFSAMRHWEEKTCIRFRPKRSSDEYSILIMSGPTGVCQSFVGRISSYYQPQGVTLGQYCVYFSTIVHELGHAVGFYHEHNRPDRDEHVEVRLNNVVDGLASAFNKARAGSTNLLGYGYDYASIMHYSSDAFSANGQDTIVAKDSSIPFGDAEELSPLDIAKANALYNCGPSNTWPPINTVVPENTISLPQGITCGEVSDGQTSGTFTTPGFPSYRHNLDCAYVINVPKGYYIEIELNRFSIEESYQCTKDYVQIYYGNELTPANIARFSGTTEGRICDNRGYNLYYTIFDTTVTVVIHTDSSGSGNRGVNATFTAIDENECLYGNQCHQCVNYPGGFECQCRDGYYHSAAAGTCYDVNECAYSNGGCEHTCTNSGGSYECTCNDGYFLQDDGKSCRTTPPGPPTTPPPTTPPAPQCGGELNTASGSFQTPNWPQTYPINIQCEWFITLPDNKKLVELTCDEEPYGIAGRYPECTKDHVTFYDGHDPQSESHGPYCHYTKPGILRMSSNLAKVVFYAGPAHSSTRRGLKCNFISVDAPTPEPSCGGTLTAASGSFNSPNWPSTYPVNIDCTWRIILPDSSRRIEITFDTPYGIAGFLPDCAKDTLHIHEDQAGVQHGPYCHYALPDVPLLSSNEARIVFHAGPAHSPSRLGFRANYRSV